MVRKLALCLGGRKKHLVLRHPQAIECYEWLAFRHPRNCLGRNRERIDGTPWQFYRRRTPAREPRNLPEYTTECHILAAEYIALANAPTLQRCDVAARNVIDMNHV
jgi:hypothetical protein